jgi:hypothetical protein
MLRKLLHNWILQQKCKKRQKYMPTWPPFHYGKEILIKHTAMLPKHCSGANNDVTRGVNGVKGACEIYMANYSAAVSSTSSALATDVNLFNKGLAQLLNKDFSNASSSFAEASS